MNGKPLHQTADQIHSAAIHLLRALRRADEAAGLSGPRLSALSVVVFAGPLTLGELARAEQVRPPTMTRLVTALENAGLVERKSDPDDARLTRIVATSRGRKLMQRGREARIDALVERLDKLSPGEVDIVRRAAPLLEKAARSG
ncbi:MAG TPA: MarR family transcriptional regulator [Gemmatimonadaceae bacterium]|jgi:DNA-binding MarR family transcriptional regulator